MLEIAPGYILQRMHLKDRIRQWKKWGLSTFIEVGSGNGMNSQVFLSHGFTGSAFELNPQACEQNELRNKKYLDLGKLKVYNEDFLTSETSTKVDVVFSSMVIEHLDPLGVKQYFEKCKNCILPGGLIVCIVPANMKFWGIEDQIAGHFKRYTFHCFNTLANSFGLKIVEQTGLTYPISNILLTLSDLLVEHAEKEKLKLTNAEKTKLSGNRNVTFKTHYPSYMKVVLNEFTLYPFHLLQRLFKNNTNTMVIYCELQYEN